MVLTLELGFRSLNTPPCWETHEPRLYRNGNDFFHLFWCTKYHLWPLTTSKGSYCYRGSKGTNREHHQIPSSRICTLVRQACKNLQERSSTQHASVMHRNSYTNYPFAFHCQCALQLKEKNLFQICHHFPLYNIIRLEHFCPHCLHKETELANKTFSSKIRQKIILWHVKTVILISVWFSSSLKSQFFIPGRTNLHEF